MIKNYKKANVFDTHEVFENMWRQNICIFRETEISREEQK